jgi:hypothetical protein
LNNISIKKWEKQYAKHLEITGHMISQLYQWESLTHIYINSPSIVPDSIITFKDIKVYIRITSIINPDIISYIRSLDTPEVYIENDNNDEITTSICSVIAYHISKPPYGKKVHTNFELQSIRKASDMIITEKRDGNMERLIRVWGNLLQLS